MSSFVNKIKSIDIFGYRVQLNIDSKNNTHKTWCGVLVTLVYILLVALIILGCTRESLPIVA